ncbi:MAG: hypothetical protein QXE50_06045 [Nitrososphaerota archaeon]
MKFSAMDYHTAITVLLYVAAIASTVAGLWIIWDLVNRMAWGWRSGEKWEDFRFPLPFFSFEINHRNWTLAFDIGMSLILVGLFLAALPAWI